MDKKFVYASAVVMFNQHGQVLVAQRPPHKEIMPGYWEFPGGKLNKNETPEEAIIREIKEEIGVDLGKFFPLSFISENRSTYHIIVYVYSCCDWYGTPQGLENQAIKWVNTAELDKIDLLPSNREVITAIRQFTESR